MSMVWLLARKEWAHGLNNRYAYVLLALFATAFAVPAFWSHGGANVFLTGLADLRRLLGMFPLFIMVLAPALAMRSWSNEQALGTHELMATWPITERRLVLGKFLGLFGFLCAAVLSVLPLAFLVNSLGALDWGPVVGAFCGALLMGAACLAVALCVGRLCADPVSAFLLGLAVLAVGMFSPFDSLNLHARFRGIARGVLDVGDLLFYATLTLLFLALAVWVGQWRRGLLKGTALFAGLLLPPLLAALLLIGGRGLNSRVDLTAEGLFSLNEASLRVLEELPEGVRLQVFFSEDLPPRFQPVADFVKAQLAEYEAGGRGKLVVEYLDPDRDESLSQRANELGIYETRANVYSEKGLQAVRLWFGLAVTFGEKNEIFPSVQAIENLEYDLTGALIRLTRASQPKLLLVGPTYAEGNGVIFDIRRDLAGVYKELARNYKVDQVRLTAATELDLTGADALVIWSLHHFTEAQLYALDQYLMRGGSVLLLAAGMRVDPNVLLAQPVPRSRADDFYAHLGFMVGRDLVCDQTCTKIKYTDVRPPVLAPYPLFPVLSQQTAGLDAEHESTARLKRLVVPWSSSLSLNGGGDGVPRVIAQTSDQGWCLTDDFTIEPGHVAGPTSFERYNLALALTGRLRSYFPEAPVTDTAHLAQGVDPATVLVWGSEHLLTQTRDSSVLVWIAQTAAFLTARSELAGIDRLENAFRPIRRPDARQKRIIRWLSVAPLPLLLLLGALVRRLRRSRQSLAAEVTAWEVS